MSLLSSLTPCDIKEEAVRPHFRIIYSPFHFPKKVYWIASDCLSPSGPFLASRDIFSLFPFGHLVPIAPAQLNHFHIKITIATIMILLPSTVHILIHLISTCILYFNSHCIDVTAAQRGKVTFLKSQSWSINYSMLLFFNILFLLLKCPSFPPFT